MRSCGTRTSGRSTRCVAAAAAGLATTRHSQVVDRLVAELATFPVAKTRPFFDAMEKDKPGTGGLFAAAVDPWKCTGCLECIDVCGPGALKVQQQDAAVLDALQSPFEFLSKTPNTPARFIEGSDTPDGDTKRLMLDRANLLRHHGRPRRVPRLRRGHGDPPHHLDQPRDPDQAPQGARPRARRLVDRISTQSALIVERRRSAAASGYRARPTRPWRSGSTSWRAAQPATARPRP